MTSSAPPSTVDPELFPSSFLRLLSVVPAAVRRLHAGVADGRRAVRGEGGRFFFRGHREYRPGDDLRRVDWRVEARLGKLEVRQFDAQKDVLTEVWLDGSASMGPCRGRVASAQAAALACATGLGEGGKVRLGVLRGGEPQQLLEASEPGHVRRVLEVLSRDLPGERAGLTQALPLLVRRVPRGARLMLVSDLLTRADPGVLHAFAGRGTRGAVLHLRVPQIHAPSPGSTIVAHDVEAGTQRAVRLDAHAAARVAARAKAHADLWAHHAHLIGLLYLPFAPGFEPETLLRRIALEVP
jgi:uncharacterized protein (DUF58 family)